jgi:hypothetical protein
MDKKGEKIAHENLTAWDEGLSTDAFGTIDMDDEGMPTQRTLLIENGMLKNFLAIAPGPCARAIPAPAAVVARATPTLRPPACATPTLPRATTP